MQLGEGMTVNIYNQDCMIAMASMKDKEYDLAIVDPPYGDGGISGTEKNEAASGGGSPDTVSKSQPRLRGTVRPIVRTGGSWSVKYQTGGFFSSNDIRHWDVAPNDDYFNELFRVSKYQIIWGGNYFNLPPSRNFIVWRKLTISEAFSMAMVEYAWTNYPGNAKCFERAPQGTANEKRFHPTQKPVAMYSWLLRNYAKPGDKILDTHLGSGSSAIAADIMGFDFTGYEIDKDYYEAALDRFNRHKQQTVMEF